MITFKKYTILKHTSPLYCIHENNEVVSVFDVTVAVLFWNEIFEFRKISFIQNLERK